MSNGDTIQRLDIVELRLFIEELPCSICRFMHASQDGVEPQSVRIKQEVQLGTPQRVCGYRCPRTWYGALHRRG
jgi:hypothetical protein